MSEEKNLVLENQNNDEMQVLSLRVSKLLAEKFKYMANLENRAHGEFFECLMQLKENADQKKLPEISLIITTFFPENELLEEKTSSKRVIFNGKQVYSLFEGKYIDGYFPNINNESNISIFGRRAPELLNYKDEKYWLKYKCEIYEKYNSIGEVKDFIIYEKVKVELCEGKNSEIIAVWSDYLLTSKDDVSMILLWKSLAIQDKQELLEKVAKVERL